MTDHHVDRPEVEAGQPAQLTGTNRSIGLSVRIQRQESSRDRRSEIRDQTRAAALLHNKTHHTTRFAGPPLKGVTRRREVPGSRCARPGTPFGLRRAPLAEPHGGLAGLVAIARGKTPDPIPNSAVKSSSADGTAS